MIAKGVRFNAHKKKSEIYIVGKFYNTDIFQFSMRCHHCLSKIAIKTDPEICDYVIVSGAVKYVRSSQVTDYSAEDAGTITLPTKQEREKIEQNAMLKLEMKKKDEEIAKQEKSRIDKILDMNVTYVQAKFKGDASLNYSMRKRFRHEKEIFKFSSLDTLAISSSSDRPSGLKFQPSNPSMESLKRRLKIQRGSIFSKGTRIIGK
jgi:hypothetical protein